MASENKWFVQRFGAEFYLCRALENPLPGESSYEDRVYMSGERIYYPTREAAEAIANTLECGLL